MDVLQAHLFYHGTVDKMWMRNTHLKFAALYLAQLQEQRRIRAPYDKRGKDDAVFSYFDETGKGLKGETILQFRLIRVEEHVEEIRLAKIARLALAAENERIEAEEENARAIENAANEARADGRYQEEGRSSFGGLQYNPDF